MYDILIIGSGLSSMSFLSGLSIKSRKVALISPYNLKFKKNDLEKTISKYIKKNLPPRFNEKKNISNILNYFVKNKLLKITKKEIIKISNSIGSDVILGIYSKNLILKSNNQIKTYSINKPLYTLIVKPRFGCSTKSIYSKVKKFSKPRFNASSITMFSINFLKKMKNDLELIALRKYPKLNSLKKFLEKLSNIEFVRMTGSGSAIIAYFSTHKKCKEAEKKVKKQFRNYWCKISKTI